MRFNPTQPVVLCRSAEPPERINPLYAQGYQCCACGKYLQVSPHNVPRLKAGANPLCNACGAIFVEAASKAMSKHPELPPVEIEISPEATAQIERIEGKCALDVFPNASVRFVE
jgi:hypothetical protein